MAFQLETWCEACQEVESCLSTLPELNCGRCGQMTLITYQKEINSNETSEEASLET